VSSSVSLPTWSRWWDGTDSLGVHIDVDRVRKPERFPEHCGIWQHAKAFGQPKRQRHAVRTDDKGDSGCCCCRRRVTAKRCIEATSDALVRFPAIRTRAFDVSPCHRSIVRLDIGATSYLAEVRVDDDRSTVGQLLERLYRLGFVARDM